MSLFRNIIDAGLSANLKQNELKVFLVLLRQTIGFGKSHDHLTDKRIAQLSGLRVDRCRMAVDGLIQKGLFDGIESTDFDFRYDIPAHFLAALDNGQFFTPHIPKNRDSFREKKAVSAKRRHTSLTPTPLTSQQPQAGSGGHDQQTPIVTLPEGISPENQQACLKAAEPLTKDQQARVSHAYRSFAEGKPIRSPAGLYLSLVKAEQSGTLVVPESNGVTTEHHASFKPFDEPHTRPEESPQERASKRAWLSATAQREGVPISTIAAQFGMNHLLIR